MFIKPAVQSLRHSRKEWFVEGEEVKLHQEARGGMARTTDTVSLGWQVSWWQYIKQTLATQDEENKQQA